MQEQPSLKRELSQGDTTATPVPRKRGNVATETACVPPQSTPLPNTKQRDDGRTCDRATDATSSARAPVTRLPPKLPRVKYTCDKLAPIGGGGGRETVQTMVAVGALLCAPKQVQTLLKLLTELNTNLNGTREESSENGNYLYRVRHLGDAAAHASCETTKHIPRMAVLVTPSAAAILEDDQNNVALPKELQRLLHINSKSGIEWRSGLRTHSPGIVGKGPNKEDKYRMELAVQAQSRLKHAAQTQATAAPKLKFTFAELFAGIGGFRLGLQKVGGRCSFSSEISHEARCTYALNFGDIPFGDMLEMPASEMPSFDLLTGGFPCQSFSKAGCQRGMDDFRGNLFYEVTRVLHHHCPKAFLLENVPNLANVDDGNALARILKELKAVGRGYDVAYKVVNAYPRVPQQRLRLYFVGFLRETSAMEKFQWPDEPVLEKPPTVNSILEDPSRITDDLYLPLSKWDKIQLSKRADGETQRKLARLDNRARTLASNYRKCLYSEFVPHQNNDGSFVDHQAQYNSRFGDGVKNVGNRSTTDNNDNSIKKDTPVIKINADDVDVDVDHNDKDDENDEDHNNDNTNDDNDDVDGVDDDDDDDDDDDNDDRSKADADKSVSEDTRNNKAAKTPRFYTPRECARLQGFPDDFIVDNTCKGAHRIYHQLGNAVVPPVIEAIGQSIVDTGVFD